MGLTKTLSESDFFATGRDSPSPASLARIILYWDRVREEGITHTSTRSFNREERIMLHAANIYANEIGGHNPQ